jgi:hypothetical protein
MRQLLIVLSLSSVTAISAGCGGGDARPATSAPTEASASRTSALKQNSRLPSQYSFKFFDVPGATRTSASAINDWGVVTGTYRDTLNQRHGYIRRVDGSFVTFDASGTQGTAAVGINNAGFVVGDVVVDGIDHGYLRSPAGSITLVDFPGADLTFLTSINNRGLMVGGYNDVGTVFLYDGHSFTVVEDAPGAIPMNTGPSYVNDIGTTVGCFVDAANDLVGYILDRGHYTDVAPTTTTCLWRVNDLGIAVGDFAYPPSSGFVLDIQRPAQPLPFVCPSGEATSVLGINNWGQIVGTCATQSGGPPRGFIATPIDD